MIVSKKPRPRRLREQCEWCFESDKKLWQEIFDPESIIHPAKLRYSLALALVQEYIEPGDIVLDPMGGIGTTAVACVRDGRAGGVIIAEYEPSPFINTYPPKFDKNGFGTVEVVSKLPKSPDYVGLCVRNIKKQNPKIPWLVLHADSTKLHYLFTDACVDKVLFSPPFGCVNHFMGKASEDFKKKYKYDCGYSEDHGNIGNSNKYGIPNKIILSPPFPNANTGGSLDNLKEIKMSNRCAQKFSDDPNNIDNLKRYGNVDKVLFSPPFEGTVAFQDPNIKKWRRNGKDSAADRKYLSYNRYGIDRNNTGCKFGKTYWDDMYLIYYSCAVALKKGGMMILHLKDYVRDGKRVPLTDDTIRVVESLGFKLRPCPECGSGAGHTHRRLIENPSAWVNIRVKRWVDSGKPIEECPYAIFHENLLVFDKVV